MARLKGSIFIPKGEDAFLKCWHEGLDRLHIPIGTLPLLNNPLQLRAAFGEAQDIVTLCHFYKVNCSVYILKETPEYAYFEQEKNYPTDTVYKKSILLHTQGSRWCLFYKSKRGRVKALNRVKCNTCSQWVACEKKKHFIRDHYKTCMLCVCGNAYQKGSNHPNVCDKKKKRKGVAQPKKVYTACKTFKPDTEPHYHQHNHHADFEAIPVAMNNNMVVDSAGLWDDTNMKYLSWCGKDALKVIKNRR